MTTVKILLTPLLHISLRISLKSDLALVNTLCWGFICRMNQHHQHSVNSVCMVSEGAVPKIVKSSPCKSCLLDPWPTFSHCWLYWHAQFQTNHIYYILVTAWWLLSAAVQASYSHPIAGKTQLFPEKSWLHAIIGVCQTWGTYQKLLECKVSVKLNHHLHTTSSLIPPSVCLQSWKPHWDSTSKNMQQCPHYNVQRWINSACHHHYYCWGEITEWF